MGNNPIIKDNRVKICVHYICRIIFDYFEYYTLWGIIIPIIICPKPFVLISAPGSTFNPTVAITSRPPRTRNISPPKIHASKYFFRNQIKDIPQLQLAKLASSIMNTFFSAPNGTQWFCIFVPCIFHLNSMVLYFLSLHSYPSELYGSVFSFTACGSI